MGSTAWPSGSSMCGISRPTTAAKGGCSKKDGPPLPSAPGDYLHLPHLPCSAAVPAFPTQRNANLVPATLPAVAGLHLPHRPCSARLPSPTQCETVIPATPGNGRHLLHRPRSALFIPSHSNPAHPTILQAAPGNGLHLPHRPLLVSQLRQHERSIGGGKHRAVQAGGGGAAVAEAGGALEALCCGQVALARPPPLAWGNGWG